MPRPFRRDGKDRAPKVQLQSPGHPPYQVYSPGRSWQRHLISPVHSLRSITPTHQRRGEPQLRRNFFDILPSPTPSAPGFHEYLDSRDLPGAASPMERRRRRTRPSALSSRRSPVCQREHPWIEEFQRNENYPPTFHRYRRPQHRSILFYQCCPLRLCPRHFLRAV